MHPRPYIEFADDNTFAGRRDVDTLFDVLQRHHIRYFTESDWRIGERPELLRRLSASGCVQVLIGIESLVHDHCGMGAKRAELDRVMHAVSCIQERGVAVNGCFIVGSDGEDFESMQRLADFLADAPFADVQLTLQTPFPGTALYRRLFREGRLLADRSWSSYTLFDVTYQPDRLSVDQLESGFRNLVRHVYSPPMTARRNTIRQAIWKNRGNPD